MQSNDKEEKKETGVKKHSDNKKIESSKKQKPKEEEKKNDKSPENKSKALTMKKESNTQNMKQQVKKNQSSPSPNKKRKYSIYLVVLPLINSNIRSNTIIQKDQEKKLITSNSTTAPLIKKDNTKTNKNLLRGGTTLAPIEEKVLRKKSVTASKSIISSNQNKSQTMLHKNNTIPSNNINIIKENPLSSTLQSSPNKDKQALNETNKKVTTNSISPFRILKVETATEDENDRIVKVRKLYKDKKLHNFDKSKSYFVFNMVILVCHNAW